MGERRFNITKSKGTPGHESKIKQMEAKQTHHEDKRHDILAAIFEQSDSFWKSEVFSSQTELLGLFLNNKLAHF